MLTFNLGDPLLGLLLCNFLLPFYFGHLCLFLSLYVDIKIKTIKTKKNTDYMRNVIFLNINFMVNINHNCVQHIPYEKRCVREKQMAPIMAKVRYKTNTLIPVQRSCHK